MSTKSTFSVKYKKNGGVIFINDSNKKDKINTNELMRFNTVWTGKKESYKNTEGFFPGCNCFKQNSYSIDFYKLSECGEQLTNF